MLLHTKGWTAVVLLSLALGIGANTALFTAVNGLLLQTIAVPEPESLARVKWAGENDLARDTKEYGYTGTYRGLEVTSTVPYPTYQALRSANQTLTDVAAFAQMESLNVVVNGSAKIAAAFQVSGNFFEVISPAPTLTTFPLTGEPALSYCPMTDDQRQCSFNSTSSRASPSICSWSTR